MIRLCCLTLTALLLGGCGSADVASSEAEEPAPAPAIAFDPAKSGSVQGQVTWSLPIPNVLPIGYDTPKPDGAGLERRIAQNPNRPHIDASTRGMGDAVVFLRSIDPAVAKPWALPPVIVKIGAEGIAIEQGRRTCRTGFVRRGDSVTLVSTEATFHILRARSERTDRPGNRNDDFFSITMPKPDEPLKRILKKPGRVELSSGGFPSLSWMRADLFVCDHPYYTFTDAQGRFYFDQVPAGKAELVVWHPNWEAGKPIREPESGPITRQTYGVAFERATPVMIEPGLAVTVDVSLP